MATWSDVTSWNVLLPGFFLFFTEFSRRVRQSYLAGRKRSSAVANTKFDLCDANGGGETAKAAIKKKERIRKRERQRERGSAVIDAILLIVSPCFRGFVFSF